jgi:hypothetical protein
VPTFTVQQGDVSSASAFAPRTSARIRDVALISWHAMGVNVILLREHAARPGQLSLGKLLQRLLLQFPQFDPLIFDLA